MTVNRFRDGEWDEAKVGQPLEDASVKVRREDEWVEIWPTETPDSGNLLGQFDATSLDLSDGDPVAEWEDETGSVSSFTQETTSQQPELIVDGINGNPSIRFDGDDDYLEGPGPDEIDYWSGESVGSCYIVHQNKALGQTGYAITQVTENNPENQDFTLLAQDGELRWNLGDSREGIDETDEPTVAGVSFDKPADDATARFNGDETAVPTGVGEEDQVPVLLCARTPDDPSAFGQFDISEVLFYEANHDAETRERVESYLADKWGISL